MFVKMLLDSFDETRWIAIVLSNRPAVAAADVEEIPVTLAPEPVSGH
jgi:hypothetical protein